tara:strand:- start:227 stop:2164 length:1938 start_codon:yes stop_codon:yes gene_type:complete
MCGISGIFAPSSLPNKDVLFSETQSMASTLYHRGPDGEGVWVDETSGIGLAHRRLAIIDLSDAGHQPMHSFDQRFVISYNGEVYNANQLRIQLEAAGCQFAGRSDTEVIVNGFSIWGITETVQRLIGMFAIAAWDRKTKELSLIRDRLGIKPLYWTNDEQRFLFGSELKSLRQHTSFIANVNRNAVCSYLRYSYIPAPHSIYRNVYKLEPGKIITINREQRISTSTYWSLESHIRQNNGITNQFSGDTAEALDELKILTNDAVRSRMIADVPVGSFLSGGIDSSLVTALMQANSSNPIKSFSIGFEEADYNEADHAANIARILGTNHQELYITDTEAREIIPNLPDYYDEPFADPSQIPTFLLSKMAQSQVKVVLSGDGGDELFGGYTRYFLTEQINNRINRIPTFLRKILSRGARSLSSKTWDIIFDLAPYGFKLKNPGQKIHRLSSMLLGGGDYIYEGLISHWDNPEQVAIDGEPLLGLVWDRSLINFLPDLRDRMQFVDTLTYLPDDILTKVDRASMAVSLEARIPLLDHRLVEFSWSLPQKLKMGSKDGKWLLRELLYKYIPKEHIDRPKMGFGAPIGSWLRGPLREWASDMLSYNEISRHRILDPEQIQQKLKQHLSGERNWEYLLWDALILQSWCNRWL